MTRRFEVAAAILLSIWSIALSVIALLLVLRIHGTLNHQDTTGSVVLAVSFASVGGIIVARRGHVIGWIMLLSGTFGSLNAFAAEYSHVALEEGWPLRAATAWIAPWVWSVGAVAFPLVLLLFPTGRPPSRRWWPVAAMSVGGAVAVAGAGAIEAWPLATKLPLTGQQVFDRTGDGIYGVVEEIGLAVIAASLVLSIISLGFRYRNGTHVQRQEVKWLLLGGATTIFVMFTASPATPLDLSDKIPLFSYASLIALPAIPVAVGIAITRYRLYDIDVVINRTLVYVTLTMILAVAYLGAVVVLQQAVGAFTTDSDIAIAGSTLAVAALFRPMRSRVQAFIDQRFYRSKYDATATLERFSSRLRDEVDLEALSGELVGVVGRTMQPAHLSIWLREPVEVRS